MSQSCRPGLHMRICLRDTVRHALLLALHLLTEISRRYHMLSRLWSGHSSTVLIDSDQGIARKARRVVRRQAPRSGFRDVRFHPPLLNHLLSTSRQNGDGLDNTHCAERGKVAQEPNVIRSRPQTRRGNLASARDRRKDPCIPRPTPCISKGFP